MGLYKVTAVTGAYQKTVAFARINIQIGLYVAQLPEVFCFVADIMCHAKHIPERCGISYCGGFRFLPFNYQSVKRESHRTFLDKLNIEIKRKKKVIEANKTPTERVTPEMEAFYDKWKRLQNKSFDCWEQLWLYYVIVVGQPPVGKMDCGGCQREAWEEFEREIIRYKNKPL